ncbi:Phosphoprotein phosphatase [Mycena chlorophos]|uniref:Phosphoprotein phosphatase n=1 Tax=Mycena chlorophos TaxID=658473 RepID=A0A8H6TBQ1_MYCCL|nr:Phosphoprotein phosphatase [Mycena chlorophos]
MDMALARKLLILDLNGTLLLRSSKPRARPAGDPIAGPRPRTVHPRPYLAAFKSYLFHPDTKAWLDTMVWSSAQPESVASMVDACFAEEKSHFVAIWARDTLGLAPDVYFKKTPTTKDLDIPWKSFPAHNAQTTLLLDDSLRKARAHRQPFNHICVPEYTSVSRRRDLAVLNASKSPSTLKGPSALLASVRKNLPAAPDAPKLFDETLLAVVGILETLKTQADVARWIQDGGLAASIESAPAETDLATQLSQLNIEAQAASPTQWFEREETVQRWAEQGRNALAALQIEAVAGVRDPNSR